METRGPDAPARAVDTRGPAAPDGPDDLEQVVGAMKGELDALQTHVMRDTGPAYVRHAPTIISMFVSVVALGFAFWTNSTSNERLERQDEHAARAELRILIQRLQALPRENFDLSRTYADDPQARSYVGGFIQGETILLAQQAADLIEQLEGNVGADEYSQTAFALSTTGLTVQAEALIARGLEVADTAPTEAALLRQAAGARFFVGDIEGGRKRWEEAVNVFAKYPAETPASIAWSVSYTEMLWAMAELGQGKCPEAWRHIKLAKDRAAAASAGHPIDENRAVIEAQCGAAPPS